VEGRETDREWGGDEWEGGEWKGRREEHRCLQQQKSIF